MAMPEYTDGVLELLRIEEDNLQDFPVEKVRSTGMHIWYRELSVFDTTRAKLSADGLQYSVDGAMEYDIEDVCWNPYIECHPTYKIAAEGMCTLKINGKTMTANVGQNLTIDTDLMIAYREDGTLNNTKVSGNYEDMYLQPGNNKIEFYGGNLKVIPNWRCL